MFIDPSSGQIAQPLHATVLPHTPFSLSTCPLTDLRRYQLSIVAYIHLLDIPERNPISESIP